MSNKDCSQQSKPGLTRRKFIQSIALGSGALFLGSRWGCFFGKLMVGTMMDEYYKERDWDLDTTRPSKSKLESLGLAGPEYSI